MNKKSNNIISVFRVEHKTKRNKHKCFRGPYYNQSDRDIWDKKGRHSTSPDTPPPHLDKGLKNFILNQPLTYCLYFFGFNNLESLKKWFLPKEIKKLKELNFVIREYRINKRFVIHGEKQSMFFSNKKISSRIITNI